MVRKFSSATSKLTLKLALKLVQFNIILYGTFIYNRTSEARTNFYETKIHTSEAHIIQQTKELPKEPKEEQEEPKKKNLLV